MFSKMFLLRIVMKFYSETSGDSRISRVKFVCQNERIKILLGPSDFA